MSSRWMRSSSSTSASHIHDHRCGAAWRSAVLISSSSALTMSMIAHARAQDVEIVGDLGGELVQLVGDFVAAQGRQARQAQLQDRARLRLGQAVGVVLRHAVARIVDQRDQRRDVLRRPVAASSAPRAPCWRPARCGWCG